MTNCEIWQVLAALVAVAGFAGCGANEVPSPASDAQANVSRSAIPSDEGLTEPATAETPGDRDESPGLGVGEKAPAFELKDQFGQDRSLSGILEAGPAAIVFFRSADW
jgi:hypothetical protein